MRGPCSARAGEWVSLETMPRRLVSLLRSATPAFGFWFWPFACCLLPFVFCLLPADSGVHGAAFWKVLQTSGDQDSYILGPGQLHVCVVTELRIRLSLIKSIHPIYAFVYQNTKQSAWPHCGLGPLRRTLCQMPDTPSEVLRLLLNFLCCPL